MPTKTGPTKSGPIKSGPTKSGPIKRLPTKRLPLLPAERALKVISGRWKAVILYHLFDGPRRLSVLKTLVPDITQKVLIQQLREMEEHGLVRREIFAEIPSRVEYSATRLGLSLEPILLALCAWGQHHADELNEMHRLADCIIRPRQARQPAIA
ncbi:helix-turn-helix domain-containing protein [Mesorhizobium sp.]|uniref:winged helix-turn-helix transcriptional regulator n=1 Tax=Mesorhizobium sp. TaxID=1871066 RepID=UPI000FE96493|nr:helix-turn-helix domain-containing protein [Mesorhizobium sp.]RWK39583.1 MAG: transcriptional regulator [Mesorhizobium sp.]RWK67204.1 MAG: transcriptional regulator [Mesorhizobium sp.]RWK78158.1 MAG: transcriptional regulator [Mesorhizobium sp.]RWK80469.1 MAG: transcriptional regulator [Mesorhizobium sp.]RWL02398.1 MAG: transcriptional regulator [Mesorhizobium sp.]